MNVITLNDIVNEKCEDKEFADLLQRELLINQIAEMMVQLRQQAHLTQQELADKAGTTQPVVARLERGADSRVPSLELLTKLATAANATISIAVNCKAAEYKAHSE